MEYANKLVVVDRRDTGVALVMLNNPPLNIVTLGLAAELKDVFRKIDRDDDVRCVVLTGSGSRAFSVGSDIKEFEKIRDDPIEKKMKVENEAFNAIEFVRCPVIAAIEGHVCGGGLEITMACDLRVMSKASQAAQPEVKIGGFAGSGGAFRLPKLVGPAKALELMLLGDFIPAEECLRIGLVNRLAEPGEAVADALAMAERIASYSVESIRISKLALRELWLQTTEQGFWKNLSYLPAINSSANFEEGYSAFIEKRQAVFNQKK